MRKLSHEGKIIMFKSLATSKTVYLSLLISVPNNIVEELMKIKKKNYGTLQLLNQAFIVANFLKFESGRMLV